MAGARRYHDIARDLASDYRVPGEALADLGGRIQAAEQARPIARADAEQPAGGAPALAQELKAVFIPSAF